MKLTVLQTLDAVRDASDDWWTLYENSPQQNPFLSPDWLIGWWESFALAHWKMRFCVFRQNGTIVGIVPLYIAVERRGGRDARILSFWANPYSNRIAPLVRSRVGFEIIKELADSIFSGQIMGWDFADLGPAILADNVIQLLIQELQQRRTGCAILERYAAPFRALPENSEALLQSLSSSFRKSLRRKLTKAKKARVLIDVSSDASRLLDAMDISDETWQHEGGTGIASSQDIKKFYEEVARRFGDSGQLQFAFLSVDSVPVAFELNITADRTVYNLKVGYRKRFSALSPGIVLRHFVLCHAIAEGFTEFDFLGVSETYKMHWASGTRRHGNILFSRRRGYWWFYYLLQYKSRPLVKKYLPWALSARRWLRAQL